MRHLTASEVIYLHDKSINRYGGLHGRPDPQKIESILNRVLTQLHYKGKADIFEVAASYCIALARGHGFTDGNKRTAIDCAYLFLKRNGIPIRSIPRLSEKVIESATGKLGEEALGNFLRNHLHS